MTDKDKLSREDLRADRAAPPRRGTLHRILVLVAVLAVVLGAVLAAAYLDLSNFDSLRRALSYDKADAAGENTYDYDNDRTNRFALLGDRLLVVSTTRVSVLADDGSEVYAQEVKLDSPAIALGGRTAAVYARLLVNACAAGTVDPALDPKAFAFFLDDLFMMLQFSFSCEYYRERMAIFLGPDWADSPEKITESLMHFIKNALKIGGDRLVCDCV